jgi:hydrogenase expression/formation protein HypD
MVVAALEEKRAGVENQYARSVRLNGNPDARRRIEAVFETCDRAWRGLGLIADSGLRLRPGLEAFDAARRFEVEDLVAEESPLCIAGEIMRGLKKPSDCSQFGEGCTPERPLGAPMVSSEGACAAYHQYGRKS